MDYSVKRTMPIGRAPAAAETLPDLEDLTTDQPFRQSSVLDTPPVFDAATTPGFPNHNDALRSMESGLFNDIPIFDSIIESSNVTSSVLDFGSPPVMAGPSAPVEAVAAHVQFDYHPDMLMEVKNEDVVINDHPMPIVRATSHDHAYVNNQNEDYQILRDFLDMGREIGVVGDEDDDELNAIISDFDFGQLDPRTCYMDTYGDLTPMLNDGPEEVEEEVIEEVPDGPEVTQDQPSVQLDEPSTSATVYRYDEATTSTLFEYAPSPDPESSCSSTTPKPARRTHKGLVHGLVKDEKYWERRKKNNVASARSRQTRKERAKQIELERQQLEIRNGQLKEEVARLTCLVNQHKSKFFSAFKK